METSNYKFEQLLELATELLNGVENLERRLDESKAAELERKAADNERLVFGCSDFVINFDGEDCSQFDFGRH